MAKIKFTEMETRFGPGMGSEFDGERFEIEFFPGDSRTHAEKVVALKKWLAHKVRESAINRGRPLPEEGE